MDFDKEPTTPFEYYKTFNDIDETLLKRGTVDSGEYNVDTASPSALELEYRKMEGQRIA